MKNLGLLNVKMLCLGLCFVFYGQVKGQMVISQLITGSTVSAVEVYNHTTNSITLTSSNFGIQRSPSNKTNAIETWSPSSDIILGGREVLVVVFAGSQKDAFITYLEEVNATYRDASGTLSSLTNDAARIAYNASGSISTSGPAIDGIGEWLVSNAGFNGGSSIDGENLERETAELETGYTATADVTGTGFTSRYSAATGQASITAPYSRDDFEGFGLSPGNFVFNGTNWITTDGTGTSTLPTVSTSCVLEIQAGNSASIDNNKSTATMVLGENASLTLGANSSGYSQAKRIVRRLNNGTVTSERYFGNDGWHIIGSPFANGFSNTQGRGVNARYWYWIGGEWTEATGSTVPAGLAIMVRVGSAYSYSYTGGGAGSVSTGNGGNTDAYTSFTWDRTGASDGDLFYVSDGHSSVSQGSGWNLLSNPLPCALDWNAMYDNGNTTNIDATVYIWDPTTNGWITYNAQSDAGTVESGLIPPNGAFLIKVSSDAAASISVDVDSHGSLTVPSSSYNKQFSYPTDVIHVGITDVHSSASNYFMVSDNEIGTADYDPGLDSWFKISTGDNIPDVFMPEGEHGQIFQNVTDLSQPQSIPVGTTDLVPGNTYLLGVEQFVDGNDYHVTLEDTYTNSMIDLSLQAYSFTQLYESVDDRFILHINQNTVGVDEVVNHEFYSYTQENELFLNAGSLDIKRVKVFTMDGKMIGNIQYKEDARIIELPSHGIYILEIEANQGVFTDKVMY
jgi:hypothetical protein